MVTQEQATSLAKAMGATSTQLSGVTSAFQSGTVTKNAPAGPVADAGTPNKVARASSPASFDLKSYYPSLNMNVQTTTPSVLTSESAQKKLEDITKQHSDNVVSINNQAGILANAKYQEEQALKLKQEADAKKKLEADKLANEKEAIRLKGEALKGAGAGTTGAPSVEDMNKVTRETPHPTNSEWVTITRKDGTSQLVTKDMDGGYSPVSQADIKLQELMDKQASDDEKLTVAMEKVNKTIDDIRNGVIPLNAGEQAQVDGLKQSYKQLIDQQILDNKAAVGTANIRGYQKGAAEYDPSFDSQIIGNIISAGSNKVADLNIKMASAVASLTQAFRDDNIKAIQTIWNNQKEIAKERATTLQKTIDDAQAKVKSIQDARTKVKDDINKVALEAAKNGADPETQKLISTQTTLGGAIEAAGDYMQTGTGTIGEYLYYKREATKAGQTPLTFDEYQTRDANRKIALQKLVEGTGMNTTQQAVFNQIVSKYTASPAITALARANQLKNILIDAEKNPGNAGTQLNLLYAYIKGLDTDSAVREGELGLVTSISNYFSKFGMQFNKLANNQAVPKDIMADMISGGKTLIKSIEDTANRKTAAMRAQAVANGTQVSNAWDMYQTNMQQMGNLSDELVMSEADAEKKVGDYGLLYPDKQPIITKLLTEVDPTLGRALNYGEILQVLNVQ